MWSHFWEPKSMIFEVCFCTSRGLFLDLFPRSFSCAVLGNLFSLHLAQKGHPRKLLVKNTIFNELFNVRAPAGGTARKAREAQKENQNSTQKTPQKQRNHRFFQGPGPSLQKSCPKPLKSDPPMAKMIPGSGPGGAGSGPRGSKTTQPQEPLRGGL